MTRILRNTEGLSDDTNVAPRPYDPDGFGDEFAEQGWRKTLGYQPGDVLWIERGGQPLKVQVVHIILDFTSGGWRIPRFRCRYVTKAGAWSKQWIDTWPGFIERGYALAGGTVDA